MKIIKKGILYFLVFALANFGIENLQSRYLEIIIASSFKLDQFIEDDE